jgi:hypothetical protein
MPALERIADVAEAKLLEATSDLCGAKLDDFCTTSMPLYVSDLDSTATPIGTTTCAMSL